MIRMISGSTRIGKRIYTPVDGCFEATPEVEERLVTQKVAVFVPEKHAEDVATPPAGSDDDQTGNGSAALGNGAEAGYLAPEQLSALTCDRLRALAEDMGISTGKLKTKAQLIDAIISKPVVPGNDAPPTLSAEPPVV